MKSFVFALGALALATSVAQAEPVNKYTITGYAASAAAAENVPANAPQHDATFNGRVHGRIMNTGAVRYERTTSGGDWEGQSGATNQGAGTSRSSDANNG